MDCRLVTAGLTSMIACQKSQIRAYAHIASPNMHGRKTCTYHRCAKQTEKITLKRRKREALSVVNRKPTVDGFTSLVLKLGLYCLEPTYLRR